MPSCRIQRPTRAVRSFKACLVRLETPPAVTPRILTRRSLRAHSRERIVDLLRRRPSRVWHSFFLGPRGHDGGDGSGLGRSSRLWKLHSRVYQRRILQVTPQFSFSTRFTRLCNDSRLKVIRMSIVANVRWIFQYFVFKSAWKLRQQLLLIFSSKMSAEFARIGETHR